MAGDTAAGGPELRWNAYERERWGKLTDDDWQTIAGKKERLVGRIQERYGIAAAEAEKQADEWSHAQKQSQSGAHLAARL